MSHDRSPLPAEGDRYVTDAGLETELVFHDGLELPYFSAATLLEKAAGRNRLKRYYQSFVNLAETEGTGVVIETPTWRVSHDWAARLGWDRAARQRIVASAVELLMELRMASPIPHHRFVISGNLGPRYDGYSVEQRMTTEEATHYHDEQVADLAAAGVDAISCLTITTAEEAMGIAQAAGRHGFPCTVSLTVETDGRLPSGEEVGDAISRIDADAKVAYFGINCAHPSHFLPAVPANAPWRRRIGLLRANASKKSHAELDGCDTLDVGDPHELASDYSNALARLPGLRVFGGCCGTDLRHVKAIFAALPRTRAVNRARDAGLGGLHAQSE